MKPSWRLGVALVTLLAAAVLAFRLAPYAGFRRPAVVRPAGTVVRGAIHVHLPGETGTFHDIIEAARDQELDFVIFTTGGGLDAAGDGREGYYTVRGRRSADASPLLVLIAAEAPTDRGNLLLLAGGPDAAFPLTRRASILARAAVVAGGLAVALGPCAVEPAQEALVSAETPDPPDNVSGIEAMSLVSSTRTSLYLSRALAATLAPWNLDGALASMTPTWFPDRGETAPLAWAGAVAPLGGVARHPGHTWFDGGAEFGRTLGWVVTRVRLERSFGRRAETFPSDRATLIAGLAAGRTLAAAESWGDPSVLRLDRVGPRFRARIPGTVDGWLVLRQNGTIRASGPGPTLAAEGGGPWRAEVYRRRRDVGLTGDGFVLWIVAADTWVKQPT